MSASDSKLSSTGFDYVVAVTQDSINGALEEYLYNGGPPEIVLCYVYDSNNNPTPIDYATFIASANKTDPFAVPDATPSTDARVQNLSNANFAFAIKGKLGLSPGVPPASLPPIVVLKPGQSSVGYTLTFAEFVATEIIYGPRNSMTWVNKSQPKGQPWTFQTVVDLNFQDSDFTNLSPTAQQRLKDLGDPSMFSIQQLYYDLNNAALESVPTFNDIPSDSLINSFMQSKFVSTYWTALQKAEQNAQSAGEVFGFGAKQLSGAPPSTLRVTDLNFFTPAAYGTEGAPLALNYLCATDNDPLPDTTHAGFDWNWIEPAEASQYDGVAALNRNTLARYYDARLRGYAEQNCYSPAGLIAVSLVGTFPDYKAQYQWGLSSGQTPAVTFPPSGAVVLTYSYDSGDTGSQAGADGWAGRMDMSSQFNLSVTFQGNTVVVVQHLVIWCYVRFVETRASGNIVDKQITDRYSLGVDAYGRLVASASSSDIVDNSQIPSANGFLNFFANVDKLASDAASWAQTCVGTRLTDLPASAVQSFVFPANTSFVFADANFSNNQDLVSHITYAASLSK
jgi:hypothetical protein